MALSLKKQQIIYLGIILLLFTSIIVSIYYLLGGFDEVKVYTLPGEKKNVIGKYFKGYYAHPDLEGIWKRSKELLDKGEMQGELALINYSNDSLKRDEVEQFLGISLTGGMAEIPSGFEVLEIQMEQKLAIFLSMHPLVRPRPNTIEKMIQKHAQREGLQLEDFTIELHFEDNSMTVEVPVIAQNNL